MQNDNNNNNFISILADSTNYTYDTNFIKLYLLFFCIIKFVCVYFKFDFGTSQWRRIQHFRPSILTLLIVVKFNVTISISYNQITPIIFEHMNITASPPRRIRRKNSSLLRNINRILSNCTQTKWHKGGEN